MVDQLTLSVKMEGVIDVVVRLDVHLGRVKNVEVAHVQFDISASVWNWALTCKNLGHIVILNVSEGFFVVFGSSAAQVMEILDQGENSSVHLHQIDKGHAFATELGLEVDIENLGEGRKDNINLLLRKNLQTGLILKLKAPLINQQQAWQTKQVYYQAYHQNDWA